MHSQTKPTKPSSFFTTALIDAVAPIVTYFVLHGLGTPPLVAMIVGSLIALLTTVINTIRQKRLDGVGLLVLAEIGISIALQFLLRDPRLLLIKPSFYSIAAAFYLFMTARGDHPLTYEGARPMATQGDPARAIAYERAWNDVPRFRALHRAATIGWGAAFLADALLRILIVYTTPMDRALWLGQIPHIAAIVLLVGFSALVGRNAKPFVEAQLQTPVAKTA